MIKKLEILSMFMSSLCFLHELEKSCEKLFEMLMCSVHDTLRCPFFFSYIRIKVDESGKIVFLCILVKVVAV